MDKFTFVFPDSDPPSRDPGICRDCGQNGQWLKMKTGAFMGKDLWLTTLNEGLCQTCLVRFEENKKRAEEQKHQDQRTERRFRYLVHMLGGKIPAEQFNFKKANPNLNRGLYRAIREFRPENENMFIFGAAGIGKTVLSTAVAREVLDAGKRAMVLNMRRLNHDFQKHEMDGTSFDYIEMLARLDLLVIDDFGTGTVSDFREQNVCEILDQRRYEGKNGLIVNSNLSLDDVASRFSDRVASRIRGMCKPPHGNVIEAIGEDLRLRIV